MSDIDEIGEPKHTPGPWEVNGKGQVVAPNMPKVRYGKDGEIWDKEHDYIVCQPHLYVSVPWNSDEMKANERIIASAPQQQAIIDNLRGVLIQQRDTIDAQAKQLATLTATTLSPTERAIIKAMCDDWLARYEPGDGEWDDAKKIDAWLAMPPSA